MKGKSTYVGRTTWILALAAGTANLACPAAGQGAVGVQLVRRGTPTNGVVTAAGYSGYVIRVVSDSGDITGVDLDSGSNGIFGNMVQRWSSMEGNGVYDLPSPIGTAENLTHATGNFDSHILPPGVSRNVANMLVAIPPAESLGAATFLPSGSTFATFPTNSNMSGYTESDGNGYLIAAFGIVASAQSYLYDLAYVVVPTSVFCSLSAVTRGGTFFGANNLQNTANIDYYTGPDGGNWNTYGNWNTSEDGTGYSLGSGSRVTALRGSLNKTVNFDGTHTGAAVYIDPEPGTTITISHTAGAMNATRQGIGVRGIGIYHQTGGSNTANEMSLADQVVAQGTYILDDGSLSVTDSLYVGGKFVAGGTAQFQLNGGSLSVANQLKIWDRGTFHYNGGSVGLNVLSLSAGSRFLLSPGDDKTLRVQALAVAGKLDLADNHLIVDYSGAVSPIDNIRASLIIGRAGGSWTGNGITSSSAAADPDRTALALGEASDLFDVFPATFGGQPVDDSSVLVKFTYLGDTNLDGMVDITDLGNLATNWQTSNVWTGGDLNYDGFVDIADLGLLAINWQAGVGNPLKPTDGDPWAFAEALGLPGAAVPEPGLIGVLAGVLGLSRARRRGAKNPPKPS